MELIPVLDLLDGVVVRGVAGRRDEYRPVVSRLAGTPDALAVAQAFRDQLGLSRLYIADLDAILHARPNRDVYRTLAADGFELFVDAGLRNVSAAVAVLDAGAARVIVGLETWPAPDELAHLCAAVGAKRVIFSLDLKLGVPLGNVTSWHTDDPLAMVLRAVEAGVRQIIVLDLAQVGAGSGVTTSDLCRRLLKRSPDLHLITGGGVRDILDLDRLDELGIAGVLLASALHDGRIGRNDIDRFRLAFGDNNP
jgi:phosphoribosylformimino-5-aminoimidazole carboxamide ribotide isomerase